MTELGRLAGSAASPLLEGAIDLHVHAGPSSVMRRKHDVWHVSELAARSGMRAVVLKDHYVPTQDLASLVRSRASLRPDFHIFGAICLNASVGGLNAAAVESALLGGARVVFMPTVSARHHTRRLAGPRYEKNMPSQPIRVREPIVLSEEACRSPAVSEILQLMAQHEAILSTGHLSADEILQLIPVALEHGVKRILLTHAPSFNEMTREFVGRVRELGVYFEVTALPTLFPELTHPITRQSAEEVLALLRLIGPERVVLSSDVGHPDGPICVEGFGAFLELLQARGLSTSTIRMMACDNAASLLGLAVRAAL